MEIKLMIVGAQKSGTTSLKNYLGEHPQLRTHPQFEMSFFADDSEYEKGFATGMIPYFGDRLTSDQFLIAKNVTISINETAMRRLAEHNSDCKIAFIMRDPVQRAYSAYTMAVRDGWMHNDFAELEEIIERKQYTHPMYYHFVQHGIYAAQLKMILRYVKPENIRIYLFEDLEENSILICKDLFKWMGVDEEFIPETSIRHNVTLMPKSRTVGKVLHGIRRPENIFRKFVKRILPYSLFSSFRDAVLMANTSSDSFKHMPDSTYQVLTQHFQSKNIQLGTLLSSPVHRSSLRLFQPNSWLKTFLELTDR
jgi:hypothetical protein